MGLEGLMKGVERLLELMESLVKQDGEATYHREVDLTKQGHGTRAACDINLRVRSLQGLHPPGESTRDPAEAPKILEPMMDVFDEPSRVVIIAQMPGVTEDEVEVFLDQGILVIEANGKKHRYYGERLLPEGVQDHIYSKSFLNETLEVCAQKVEKDCSQ